MLAQANLTVFHVTKMENINRFRSVLGHNYDCSKNRKYIIVLIKILFIRLNFLALFALSVKSKRYLFSTHFQPHDKAFVGDKLELIVDQTEEGATRHIRHRNMQAVAIHKAVMYDYRLYVARL